MGRGKTSSQEGRHGKIFFIAVFVLSFSKTFMSFSVSTELHAKNNEMRRVLFAGLSAVFFILCFFSVERGGTGQTAGRWDNMEHGGTGQLADGTWRENWRGGIGRDNQ